MNTKEKLVTLETLEPGDRVEKGGVRYEVVDFTNERKVVFLKPVSEGTFKAEPYVHLVDRLELSAFKPVQPAPAEKEEEWWNKNVYRVRETYDFYDVPRDGVEKLVIEAKRRGAEEAWRECRFLVAHTKLWSKGNVEGTRQDILARLDAKLESLNRPLGNYEY